RSPCVPLRAPDVGRPRSVSVAREGVAARVSQRCVEDGPVCARAGPRAPGIGTVAGVDGQEYRGGTTRSAKEPAMTNLEARYDHVIIGGGVAADSAARAIREASPDATIAILSADPHEPVYRPALSKDL